MAKGHTETSKKRPSGSEKSTIAICPECKSVIKPESAQCPSCGAKLR